MRFVDYEEKYKIKKSEHQLLVLLDRNIQPSTDFIKVLASKVQKLALAERIRK